MVFANVIVDLSIEKLDKTFQYRIPPELEERVAVGMQVRIPFGRRQMTGYVLELTDKPELDLDRIKPILGLAEEGLAIENQLIALAAWMRTNYGSTMNQALKTVLPVKQKTRMVEKKVLFLNWDEGPAKEQLALFEAKHYKAKARLLRELIQYKKLDYSVVTGKLQVSAAVVRSLQEMDLVRMETYQTYRNPLDHLEQGSYDLTLNTRQQEVVDQILEQKGYGVYLIHGVTGSGKTEVYMELIAQTLAEGKQAIMLIPEISLTYQTVMRFRNRFGDRVSILNSRMSAGERYDQYLRAKSGDIDIMIGPRSALFTPFERLGLILIDEEHEPSYKSETAPRYHAREVAIQRAKMTEAKVILGSATPSVESYYLAQQGIYKLLEMKERVEARPLPECQVVDLREELKRGNRSILSIPLQELMEDRLAKGQQTMLFLNRRGIAGVLSCYSCGEPVKCPHCDVSMSLHNTGDLVCHYCGYQIPKPSQCPHCGSPMLGTFKAGTQKVEELVKARFPQARILRMDYDTTRTKDSYEQILQSFGNGEADILIGTQMIVKGHDFANVTLMGILAADTSLSVGDYHAAERTFALLTQAAGRAGRGDRPGQVVIQAYQTEHYALLTAKNQDYESFYKREIAYRSMMHYPPVWNLLVVQMTSANQEVLELRSNQLAAWLKKRLEKEVGLTLADQARAELQLIGPADAAIAKINDQYRKAIMIKGKNYGRLIALKDDILRVTEGKRDLKDILIQFDFNPMSGF